MSITPAGEVPPGAVTNRLAHLIRTVQVEFGHVDRHYVSLELALERGNLVQARYDAEHIGNHLEAAQEHLDKYVASMREDKPAVGAEIDALDEAMRDLGDDAWRRESRAGWR